MSQHDQELVIPSTITTNIINTHTTTSASKGRFCADDISDQVDAEQLELEIQSSRAASIQTIQHHQHSPSLAVNFAMSGFTAARSTSSDQDSQYTQSLKRRFRM